MLVTRVRNVSRKVERVLWARAAGRCEFNGCNRILYKSPITMEDVNIAEKAHIYSFSESGPRGWGPFALNKSALNDISNLLLVCHDCHETIDQDKAGVRYSAELLQKWKTEHEERVKRVTGINPNRKSHVVLYGANIGSEKSPLQYDLAVEAMFKQHRWPAEENPLVLSMTGEHRDSDPYYWETEKRNLLLVFERVIRPRIEENNPCHFSIFALAPQPLLILLGTLFTDKIETDVYQLHREPRTWEWQGESDENEYIVTAPEDTEGAPAFIISISDVLSETRIKSVLGDNVSIWEIRASDSHNDIIKHRNFLAKFRATARKIMRDIKRVHGKDTPLAVFPAMPISCAIEFGRIRMPKADMPWIIYDQSNEVGGFIKTTTIGGD